MEVSERPVAGVPAAGMCVTLDCIELRLNELNGPQIGRNDTSLSRPSAAAAGAR
jgi:hypothetical protein